MYLVMLETNGNQRYVFSSPRLKENVGASFLLTRLAPWTREAANHLGLPDDAWVSRSSGKVILQVRDRSTATRLISTVTARALAEAPGMDVSGVMVKMGRDHVTDADLKNVHTEAAQYALSRPPAAARFPMAPFLQPAADSSLPASEVHEGAPRSLPSLAARRAAKKARDQLVRLAQQHPALRDRAEHLVRTPDDLEDFFSSGGREHEAAKAAVLHLDGNGVGAMVRDLGAHLSRLSEQVIRAEIGEDLRPGDNDLLRRAELELNKRLHNVMEQAFLEGWAEVARLSDAADRADASGQAEGSGPIPVVPVILGGDDATVITAGDYALPFAARFLTAFEEATADDALLYALNGGRGLTAGAGVAITDRSFPFHLSYELAEGLASRAKAVGKALPEPRSMLMHHVLYDSTLLDPQEVLSFYQPFEGRFSPGEPVNGPTARPFIVDACRPSLDDRGTEPPVQGESWSRMLARVAWFRGLLPVPGAEGAVAFPRTRAARIRRALSDAVAAAPAREDRLQEARTEWEDAAGQPDLTALTTAIGSEHVVLDLLDLADVLPQPYLTGLTADGDAASEATQTKEDQA